MLLRVAAAAGATVVLGASACGSTAGPGAPGFVGSSSEGGDEITVCNGFCVSTEAGTEAGPEAGNEGGGDSGPDGLVDGSTD